MNNYLKIARIKLICLEILVGLTAVAGGVALIVTNGLGMYASSVQPYFYNYTVPGLILSVVVGGTNLFAAYSVITRKNFCAEASAVAGFGLLIWILFEIYITSLSHILQLIYFAAGISVLVLTMILLKHNEIK